MAEPQRISRLDALVPYVKERVELGLYIMKKFHRLDPVVFETKRSYARQLWLYAQGRTRPGKKVTWTLRSKHLSGKAVDVISASTGWSDPKFFDTLKVVMEAVGLHGLGANDRTHFEWRG